MVSKEEIITVFDKILSRNIKEKCPNNGTKGSSGRIYGEGEAPRFEKSEAKLTNDELNNIADVMAERWGLEVSIDKKGKREVGQTKFSLWDNEHKTLLRLNKVVKHQEWVDFTNNGEGVYDLDEVLSYYNDLAPIQKDRMGAVLFETKNGASWNHLYDRQTDTINPIHITSQVYYNRHNSRFSMRQVIGHESGHASERRVTQEMEEVIRKCSVGVNSFRKSVTLSSRESDLYDELISQQSVGVPMDVSRSKEYDDAMNNNKVRNASEYSASYAVYGRNHSEDLAEVMSAVSYRNTNDKSDFHIKYTTGETVGWEKFVSDHKATYDLCCDYLDGKIDTSKLHSPFSGKPYSEIDKY